MERTKVILFGTGKIYRTFIQMYDSKKIEIIGTVDNDKNKQGKIIDGFTVYAPSDLLDLEMDIIIITTAYVEEIKRQLLRLGIKNEMIYNFHAIFARLSIIENDIWHSILREDFYSIIITQQNKTKEIAEIRNLQEKTLYLAARNFINSMPQKINNLSEVGFQVSSQFDEDGIIQWLIKNADIPNKIFVEFGVEDYSEANTRFLLMNNNWSGLVIDGSKENINRLRSWDLFWKYDLTAVDQFITKDNINQIIVDAGISGDIGILSVDVDGNDYWILSAIECVKPRILICEYNNIFGGEKKVTIPYEEEFQRTLSHYSNLYWGASLGAFCDYAEKKGYYYFGSNGAGNNAFFVRKDCIDKSLIPTDSKKFVVSKYRESRDEKGKLNFLSRSKGLEVIKDKPLVDLETGEIKKVSEIF